jgi:hypothetical protein
LIIIIILGEKYKFSERHTASIFKAKESQEDSILQVLHGILSEFMLLLQSNLCFNSVISFMFFFAYFFQLVFFVPFCFLSLLFLS